jgi:hypothetical protein
MFLFEFQKDGKGFKKTLSSSMRDPELLEELAELKAFYGKGVKAVEIGRMALKHNRSALYSDLTIANKDDLKTIKMPMLIALIEQDFSNDNMTYFMLERGLVDNKRERLSAKGMDIVNAFNQSSSTLVANKESAPA